MIHRRWQSQLLVPQPASAMAKVPLDTVAQATQAVATQDGFFSWIGASGVTMLEDLLNGCHLMGADWWIAIPIATVALRAAVFPLKVVHQVNQHRMTDAQKEFNTRIAPLVTSSSEGERKQKLQRALTQHFIDRRVSLLKLLLPIFVNVPLFIGMTRALRSVDFEGSLLFWMTPLAEAHPGAAILTIAVNALVLRANQKYLVPQQQTAQQPPTILVSIMPPFLHVLNLASYLILAHMPAAVNWYFAVSNLWTWGESAVLRTEFAKRLMRARGVPC